MPYLAIPLPLLASFIERPTSGMIEVLWEAWDVQATDHERGIEIIRLSKDIKDNDPKNSALPDGRLYHSFIGQLGRLRRLELVKHGWDTLTAHDKPSVHDLRSPMDIIGAGKRQPTSVKMGHVVAEADRWRQVGDRFIERKNCGGAIAQYLKSLAYLAPWSSDASIMTLNQPERSGLSLLEQTLAYEIALYALRAASSFSAVGNKRKPYAMVAKDALSYFDSLLFASYRGIFDCSKLELSNRFSRHELTEVLS